MGDLKTSPFGSKHLLIASTPVLRLEMGFPSITRTFEALIIDTESKIPM